MLWGMRISCTTFVILTVFALSGSQSAAESELGFYGGAQSALDGIVGGSDPGAGGIGDFSFSSDWEGRSFEAPRYFGVRFTQWNNDTYGWGFEFNHAKVYADEATLTASGLSTLEFSDGVNLLTMNVFRRFPAARRTLKPYVGAGIGVAIPNVAVESGGGTTSEYQITGPAVQLVAGAKYELKENWSVFGEYKGSYSVNKANLVNGGELNTNIATNAVNIGVSLGF